MNGRLWRMVVQGVLELVIDAGDSGIGTHVPQMPGWRFACSLSALQDDLRRLGLGANSTVREAWGYCAAFCALYRAYPDKVRAWPLQIWGDSQAAIADCAAMRGDADTFPAVKALHTLAWQRGVRLAFVWHRRSTAWARQADALSKRSDDSDWGLSRSIVESTVFQRVGRPDLDVLANDAMSMCKLYFAEVDHGRCAAVDGMVQRWDEWPLRSARGAEAPLEATMLGVPSSQAIAADLA